MTRGARTAPLCLLLLIAAPAEAAARGEVSALVTFRGGVDLRALSSTKGPRRDRRARLVEALRARADASQGRARALLRRRGARRVTPLWITNSLAVTARPDVIAALAQLHEVERVEHDARLSLPPRGDAEATSPWNLDVIGAPALWRDGITGAGVVVASVDTGADLQHPDLAARWRGGANSWLDTTGEHDEPHDGHGHGTQTLGLMVGGDASGAPLGVAPGARWIAAKVYDQSGQAALNDVQLALQWLLDPDGEPATDDAPDVVNASWGFTEAANGCLPDLEEAIAALRAADIVVVVSAGNAGPLPLSSLSPANYEGVLSVGAVDETARVAAFSSRGPSACTGGIYPSVVAPGVGVRTADLSFGGVIPEPYAFVTGTSFASAQVAGAAALLRGAFPGATAAAVEDALAAAAVDLSPPGADVAAGYGLVDVNGARVLLEAGVSCPDDDDDGFRTAPCGSPADCDDGDPTVHPGSDERPRDDVDQDCNGYDLTLALVGASYRPARHAVRLEATSALGDGARLEVRGHGPMRWDPSRARWRALVPVPDEIPEALVLAGLEGELSLPVRATLSRSP